MMLKNYVHDISLVESRPRLMLPFSFLKVL